MRLWFYRRYRDPQIEKPYIRDAGCYSCQRGGPIILEMSCNGDLRSEVGIDVLQVILGRGALSAQGCVSQSGWMNLVAKRLA